MLHRLISDQDKSKSDGEEIYAVNCEVHVWDSQKHHGVYTPKSLFENPIQSAQNEPRAHVFVGLEPLASICKVRCLKLGP